MKTTVADVVARRGIDDVLHFTTNKGLVGILASEAGLPRRTLPREKYLEHVYQPNAGVRKDARWLGYVNLSITRLNWEFFGHSYRWHRHEDVWWCGLAFDPAVLEKEGVIFATSNNIHSGCARAAGPDGLEALFDDVVYGAYKEPIERPDHSPSNWTTDHQAEVLVPERVETSYLRRIIVATPQHLDIAHSQCEILLGDIPIDVDPTAFEPQPIS